MKKEYSIFFAIPFDALVKNTYECIKDELIEKFKKKNIKIIINIGVEKYPDGELQTFKEKNGYLFNQFVDHIRNADIIVADLTNNNPNVNIEIGVALSFNKNVLRLQGRDFIEVGSDIRDREIQKYTNRTDLVENIYNYIVKFDRIKNLNFDNVNKEDKNIYYYDDDKQKIEIPRPLQPINRGNDSAPPTALELKLPDIRDFVIRIEFEIVKDFKDDHWFGVAFRKRNPFIFNDEIIAYCRSNGKVGAAEYPYNLLDFNYVNNAHEEIIFDKNKTARTMDIEVEGDMVKIINAENRKSTKGKKVIGNNSFGKMYLMVWNANAICYKYEIICRDTVNPESQYL